MAIRYRPACETDLAEISAVFTEAHNDLQRRRGFAEVLTNPPRPPAILSFLLRRTPQAFWVAEEDGGIVGFADSFLNGTLWFLAWLFVSPSVQGRGVGRELLERTLAAWGSAPIENRATMTFAINPVSQSLYMRYGMYAREPVYRAHGPAQGVLGSGLSAAAIEHEEIVAESERRALGAHFGEPVIGFALDWHHDFLAGTRAKCFAFGGRRQPLGYAYVGPNGAIGPVAVASPAHMRPVLAAALALAAGQGADRVSYWTPGSNAAAIDLALAQRMELEPFVHMSARPFAHWENYLYHSAALM